MHSKADLLKMRADLVEYVVKAFPMELPRYRPDGELVTKAEEVAVLLGIPLSEAKARMRRVRDSAFWGLPAGTPIKPGMKPRSRKRSTGAPRHHHDVVRGKEALSVPPISLDAIRPKKRSTVPSTRVLALESYMSHDYKDIAAYLRRGENITPTQRRYVRVIDNMMSESKLSRAIEVHRVVHGASKIFGDNATGKIFIDENYLSATADKGFLKKHAPGPKDRVYITLLVPAGVGAIRMSDIDPYGEPYKIAESEILLDRKLPTRVISDNVVNGERRMVAEVMV